MLELEVLPCFRTPISVKVTSSGDEGWECEEGDCVWYPLEGLPGLGLELPDDPAYRMTPPPETKEWRTVVNPNFICVAPFRHKHCI